jgi:hypothetical protein
MAASPFRVIWPIRQQAEARRLASRSIELGVVPELVKDLKIIANQLASAPSRFGDPIYNYHHLDLTVYRAILSVAQIYYAVDPVRRLVYVKEIASVPGGALDA